MMAGTDGLTAREKDSGGLTFEEIPSLWLGGCRLPLCSDAPLTLIKCSRLGDVFSPPSMTTCS